LPLLIVIHSIVERAASNTSVIFARRTVCF
jgi:hypothetical protein